MNRWQVNKVGGKVARLTGGGGCECECECGYPDKKDAASHAFLFHFAPSGHVRPPHTFTHSAREKQTGY